MLSYDSSNDECGMEKAAWDQYRVWKKHVPQLYSHVTVHPLEWPALSLDWLPEDDCRDYSGYTVNYLLMGTHAFSPSLKEGVERNAQMMNFGSSTLNGRKPVSADDNNAIYNLACTLPSDIDQSCGFDVLERSALGRIGLKQRLAHQGEVNIIKHMPQNPHVIASRGPAKNRSTSANAPVYIYYLDNAKDLTDQQHTLGNTVPLGGNGQIDDALYVTLVGHKDEGFALSWNKKREGLLASGADDGLVIIWDLEDHVSPSELTKFENGHSANTKGIAPLVVLKGHVAEVQGVDFHPSHQHLLFSVSDDRSMRIWDTRLADKGAITTVRNAHASPINCVQVHPFAEHVVATAGKDVVKIWDIRFEKRSEPTMTLRGHSGDITCMEWAPHAETVLATGSTDRTVVVWDMERHNNIDRHGNGRIECCPWFNHAWSAPSVDESQEDDLAIPKGIMFVHFGHTAPITSLSWNPNEDWFLASAAQDNMLHIWKMSNRMRSESDNESEPDFGGDVEMQAFHQGREGQNVRADGNYQNANEWVTNLESHEHAFSENGFSNGDTEQRAPHLQQPQLQPQQPESEQQTSGDQHASIGFGPPLAPLSNTARASNDVSTTSSLVQEKGLDEDKDITLTME
ncbi:Histone acetyltransferase type B subunit 2 [Diplonema papillatum]|nr:Histone acetyltransferase type B subunit 2 [Diplonema papillatum]